MAGAIMAGEESGASRAELSLEQFRQNFEAVVSELGRVFIGQRTVVEQVLAAMLAEGHVLLTGVPGLGRTLLGKSLAQVMGLTASRIQFTPDLLPTDIIGTEILQESRNRKVREFRFLKGPVFSNVVLADEINRSPARTQSALLEVMQERQVTLGGSKHAIPSPFFIIATMNALESEGVYPMPEAQLDRFMLLVNLEYPTESEELRVVDATTGNETWGVKQVVDGPTVLAMQKMARLVPVAPSVKQLALSLVRGTRPGRPDSSKAVGRLLRWGASPRAGQSLIRGAKVLAIVRGRKYVSRSDIKDMAVPVLRHRLVLDYRTGSAESERIEDIIRMLVEDIDRRLAPDTGSRWFRKILQLG
jgi:MoxR-like ATPase